jgi:phosphoglycolate phosphatase
MDTGDHELVLRGDALLFDKDGTLFEFAAMWGPWADRLLEEVLAESGAAVSPAELGRDIGWDRSARRYDPAGPLAVGSRPDLIGVIAGGLYRAGVPWHRAKEAVVTAGRRLDTDFDWTLRPVAGLEALLDRAAEAGLPVAVITADDTAAAQRHLEQAGLEDRVTVVVGDDAVQVGKPDPEPVYIACRTLAVEPGQAVLFGDSAGDVASGRAAGVGLVVGVAESPAVAAELTGADQVVADYRGVRLA